MTKDQESGGAPLEQLPDEALCRLIREQDRPAEEVLAARYHRVVRSCARPYFLAGGDSEDLMQEGMFGLIKAIPIVKRFRAWTHPPALWDRAAPSLLVWHWVPSIRDRT